jgi:hypothetical protein
MTQRFRLWISRSFTLAACLATLHGADRPASPAELIRDDFDAAVQQYSGMLERIKDEKGNPRAYEHGKLVMVGPKDWTCGFFPGSLWLIYEYTGDAKWKDAADHYTRLNESAKDNRTTHDLGFILNTSFGEGYRLTHDTYYRDVLLTGAKTLSTRFNPKVGAIKSWDKGRWKFPVIIDNMMNLELLMWASHESGNTQLAEVATKHADTTKLNHFRPDFSSYHVVSYDPETGKVEKRETHQGTADESSWARGQAWGLYGFTMMYRETHRAEYLEQAKHIAAFLLHHPRMPADKVPYWDFDANDIPQAPRDASAAAVMASALLELSGDVEPELGHSYFAFAEAQLQSLSSPAYRAKTGENGNFLIMHCVGNLPSNGEIDTPISYADYYYLEALSRYRAKTSAAPAK